MKLSLITLLVPSYEAGIGFFVDGLGWALLSDEDQGRKRWVTVAPGGGSSEGPALLLAVPTSDGQTRALGHQVGGRVGFFLETDDFARDAARIVAVGGVLLEEPRRETYGRVVQWRDPWGNLWDLIQPAT